MNQGNNKQASQGKIKSLNPEFNLSQIKLNLSEGREISMEALIAEMNKKNLDSPSSNETEYLRIMKQRELELKVMMKKPIEFSRPILKWNDAPIVFPYTINLIQGQTGSHKSRLAELFCSALLTQSIEISESLKLRRNSELDLTLFYVDTERNLKEQYPFALQSILRRAGYPIDTDLINFRFVTLLEFDRRTRFEALKVQLNHMRQNTDSHIVIVLDVLTDCVTDFNRTDDSMALIDLMNNYINQFDVTFICVIHENPGIGGKARGHLGTESMNKASTVLQISFEKDGTGNDTDLIRVKTLKCRNTARLAPIYMRYSQDQKGLVLADETQVQNLIDQRKPKAHIKDVVDQLEKLIFGGASQQKVLMKALCKHFQTSDKTMKVRLSEIEERELPIANGKGEPCKLVKSKNGRNVEYHLELIPTT